MSYKLIKKHTPKRGFASSEVKLIDDHEYNDIPQDNVPFVTIKQLQQIHGLPTFKDKIREYKQWRFGKTDHEIINTNLMDVIK